MYHAVIMHIGAIYFTKVVDPTFQEPSYVDALCTVDTRLGELISVMFMMDNPNLELIAAYVAVPIWNVLT